MAINIPIISEFTDTGVKKAIEDKGRTLAVGEHCRFCPALAHCPAKHGDRVDQPGLTTLPLQPRPRAV